MNSDSVKYEAGETSMTNYQFKRFEELKDQVAELSREIELLRSENAALKAENEQLKKS